MKQLTLIFLLFVLGLTACKEEHIIEPNELQQGFEYFPLAIGKYWVYDADSIIYKPGVNNIAIRDTHQFQIKEILSDTITQNGILYYVLEHYERDNDTIPWNLTNIWSLAQTNTEAIRKENNLRFIKMVYPLTDRGNWEGNKEFESSLPIFVGGQDITMFETASQPWIYEVDNIGTTLSINNEVYNDVTSITCVDDENVFEQRLAKEYYAKNIGLIQRNLKILDTQNSEAKPLEEKAERGFILNQYLKEHN